MMRLHQAQDERQQSRLAGDAVSDVEHGERQMTEPMQPLLTWARQAAGKPSQLALVGLEFDSSTFAAPA